MSAHIICDDALDTMRKMDSQQFRTVITSPPYNLHNTSGSTLAKTSGKWADNKFSEGYDAHDDNMPHDQYVEWQRECLKEMWRLVDDDGAVYYNHKWRVQNGLWQERHDITSALPLRQIIILAKPGGINFNSGYYLPSYEVVFLFAKPGFRLKQSGINLKDVWRVGRDQNNPHPAPMGEDLPALILNSLESPGRVLDPFCGSGTVLVVAEEMGLDSVGIDNSPKYCGMARRRVANARSLL